MGCHGLFVCTPPRTKVAFFLARKRRFLQKMEATPNPSPTTFETPAEEFQPTINAVNGGDNKSEANDELGVESSTAKKGTRNATTTIQEPSQVVERTLYDILGATPEDTKAELKRKYVVLAKQTHPDAVRDGSSSDIEFSQIAAAYKVLSDPKQKRRYDRRLKAEAFSRELQELAGGFAEKAAPQVQNMLDTVAVPFLRR